MTVPLLMRRGSQRCSRVPRIARILSLAGAVTVGGNAPLMAQETFGRVIRGNGEATLTVFDGRPLERAAQTLAHEFEVKVSAENPLYLWRGDLVEVSRQTSGERTMTPKPVLLEVTFPLDGEGQPANVRSLLETLIAQTSIDRPFGYRVDIGPGGYTLVPTQMRNDEGRLVSYASPLDTVVTLTRAVRPHALHASAIREQVEAGSGYHITCCTSYVGNFDYKLVEFGAHESARHALQRLGLLRPMPVVQHMRCQALTRLCFIHWTPVTAERPMAPPD